jgi:hypothetical protein
MTTRAQLNRRMFLYGAGVTIALPWLESRAVWGSPADKAAPQRFAALFMANGINYPNWWAKGAGTELELGNCLKPLEPLKTKSNFLFGLFNKNATGVGIHPGQTGNILSGVSLQKGSVLRGGVSMDQVLANHIGQETVQSSLVLGCEQPVTDTMRPTFPWCTARISPGEISRRRYPWRFIPRLPSTACSTTAAVAARRAFWIE